MWRRPCCVFLQRGHAAEKLLPLDGWGSPECCEGLEREQKVLYPVGAGLAVPLARSKSMPMNTKHRDGTRLHLSRLTTRPSHLERLRSHEVQVAQAGAVGAKISQSSRYWSRERPWPLAKAPTALTRRVKRYGDVIRPNGWAQNQK